MSSLLDDRCAAIERLLKSSLESVASQPQVPSPKSIEVTWVQKESRECTETTASTTFPEVKLTF